MNRRLACMDHGLRRAAAPRRDAARYFFNGLLWDRISECYRILEKTSSSPIHRLNRAVAVAEWKSPEAGLELVEELAAPNRAVRELLERRLEIAPEA